MFGPYKNPKAIAWYKSLDINKKIYIKEEGFELMCGMSFTGALVLFNLLEIITIFYDKLISEGIDI